MRQKLFSNGAAALIAMGLVFIGNGFYREFAYASRANMAEVRINTLPALKKHLSDQGLKLGDPIYIRIFKESRELEMWVRKGETYVLFKTYPICDFSGELGPKTRQGDNQAPEGFYSITKSQLNPNSASGV